ncbi:recombinase family protein [Klebsiella pneumoniae]|uniref:recombinase family protein n=1 Tax=Klebsiella pneumoniae TaxID=573 RepID=UPI0014475A6B|nr:recombinase family protein [Klebsiella pneumoniae]MCH9353064.1 recombinase family protein [Klebsiella pneumoniae]MCH9518475.1 recombinase family protein [Klebsiella pneumoniae]MCH9528474.1 recombinase family protein [Klebsiella pneumoniae]
MGHRAAIYCRVSTADQSCERQEFDLRAFAGRAGYDVVGILALLQIVGGDKLIIPFC